MPGHRTRKRAKAPLVLARTRLGATLRVADVERRVRRMMSTLQLYDAELSVLLTNDIQMRELNRVYRKKDRTTDVLAFPMTRESGLLGDLVVSVPVARTQAHAARRTLLDEVTMLLAHGLLHLVGWDHDTARKDRAMREETERLCATARGDQQRHSRSRKLS